VSGAGGDGARGHTRRRIAPAVVAGTLLLTLGRLAAAAPAGAAASVAAKATAPAAGAARRAPLVIGVTLHPYYSWTRNVVGDLPGFEVRPILPGEIDAGDYQPRPEDIRKLADVDVLVVNGIGHDDFIFPMLQASGNRRAVVVRPNDATPQIRSVHGSAVNSHTFISFTNAVQQTYAIQKALAALRPEAAPALLRNAEAYARRLRLIKARAAARLADAAITRVVTVHDGYGYLLQEFGLEVAGVVQPAHGLTPSAAELRDMVELLRRERVRVVFSEESFPPRLLAVLRDEAGVRVYTISHIASGAYTADKFEKEMQKNVDTMIEALVTDPSRKADALAPRRAVPGERAAAPAAPGATAPHG
jgi:zinc transport system substrate-binding protein